MAQFRTIFVQRNLFASARGVFDILADHAGYTRFPGVRSAIVTKPGRDDPNGLGAIREIFLGTAWFREEITAFEPPHRLEYRILESRPPIEHLIGRLTLRDREHGCSVEWLSTFRITTPLVGGLMTRIAQGQMSKGFVKALQTCERLVRERSDGSREVRLRGIGS